MDRYAFDLDRIPGLANLQQMENDVARRLQKAGLSARPSGDLASDHAKKVLSDFEASKFQIVSRLTNYYRPTCHYIWRLRNYHLM